MLRPSGQTLVALVTLLAALPACASDEPSDLGGRRELFVDYHLVQHLRGATLMLHEPRDEGTVLKFDAQWEGQFSAYCTLLNDNGRLFVYYRGKPGAKADGLGETTCVAESKDGRNWTKPQLGLVEINGSRSNNVILALDQLSHNFSPLIDQRPGVTPDQRFKAIAGTAKSGLIGFASADGFSWRKLSDKPLLTTTQLNNPNVFDSQNLAFWSEQEQKYVMFFRVFHGRMRRIARAESTDFLTWTNVLLMEYRKASGDPAVVEQLYTSQTHPYFRAPHIYVALAARFMPGRQVLTEAEAKAFNIHPSYFKDTSDAVFMTSRGGRYYDRTFMQAFVRPGIGAQNWVSRTTYPALNTIQTGPTEMSAYVNQDYAQPTAHLHRYSLRLDGFASVRAPHEGGELLTRPLKFQGSQLLLNFATSAAGGIRVEVQDESGKPFPGFTLADSAELIGNEIERVVRWKAGSNLETLAGKPVRLRFVMKDADLYSLRFGKL